MMFNGDVIPLASARVSPLGDGLIQGHGLFETIKVLGGAPVFFAEHFGRLRQGAATLGLAFATTPDELRARSLRVLAANRVTDGGLKIVIFQDEGRVSEMILTQPARYPPELYLRGFQLKTVGFGRRCDPTAGLKTLNYLPFALAKRAAQAAGFDEALLMDDRGTVLEGATSNVFVVKDGKVATPSLTLGILPGIVRAQMLEHLGTDPVCEGAITLEQLQQADEVFVTNSLLGVMPVARVDEHCYDLSRGSVTQAVMAEYQRLEWQSVAG